MARGRPMSTNPHLVGLVRSAVRAGLSDPAITADVLSRMPHVTEGAISRAILRERPRQAAVDRVMARDFRENANLHRIVNCGKGQRVRGRIVVQWTDPQTGFRREYGQTMELRNQGRLGTILNEAIATVLQDATGRGYTPPRITSGMRSGPTSYTIAYLECV